MFRADCLSKSFGSLAVTRDVSLDLPPGRRHGLIGPNGAGKTTLFNLLTGEIRPDGGRVYIDEVLCVGCGICAQLCPNDAIYPMQAPAAI